MNVTDVRIASALQLHGRASWDQIARVLGLPERTVARRGQRLLDEAVIRVTGVVDTQLLGRPEPVLLRLEGRTGGGPDTARALSAIQETRTVLTLLGSSDYFVELVPHSRESLRDLVYRGLPTQVRSSSSYPVLMFYSATHTWNGGALTEGEAARLRRPALPPFGSRNGGVTLQQDELDMIALLVEDGRIPTTRLAAALGISQSTASRKLSALLESGAVRVRADVTPSLFGLHTEALLWLQVSFRHLDEVGEALARRPEVMTLVSISGDYQVCAHVAVADHRSLQRFLVDVVGPLAVSELDTTIVLETFKRGGRTAIRRPASLPFNSDRDGVAHAADSSAGDDAHD
ncbi:Lrp/AsnC family transcriptional regulator [Streptomyces sp. MUM 203J]|uniref:Lrp/AsnC family transcriptional regulator n=1 Tax=Streptomyces sp. MUM 203J TaxID=2791990 RepID=UPI001F04FCF6|nr:Lrp/AsnC family transcriptional regulator [Streptomyces sp. MUM 203J]MCH0539320.1 Lrp/AsnC family transcriptional regulator [Streptomyces sp. MUM 203J]